MNVLVVGAGGQVGTELIFQGHAMGLNMIATSSSELDITQHGFVLKYIHNLSPNIVINAAAYTAVDKAEEEPDRTYAINRDGTENLAVACEKEGIPLLHISTDYVFDGKKLGAYDEDDIPNPSGIYGKSKLASEQVIQSRLTKHITLRVAWVFSQTGSNFVSTMLRLGQDHNKLSIVADQHGAPTWAGDIARTLLAIADQYQKQGTLPWGTYHYIGTPQTTWFGFAETIFSEAKNQGILSKVPTLRPISTEEYPTAAIRPKNSLLNCDKIEKELQISQPDWRIGLKQVLLQMDQS